jgi:DNA-binding response OmpR family regulator
MHGGDSMTGLRGKKILVLEDEQGLAENLQYMLTDLGCELVGVVGTIDAAFALALSSRIDAAVLDININGQDCVKIAKALRARGIPFLLATGHTPARAAKFGEAPILLKPYIQDELASALHNLLNLSV